MGKSEWHRNRIEEWLDIDEYQDQYCPFDQPNFNAGLSEAEGEVCRTIFPEIKEIPYRGFKLCGSTCPCAVFEIETVIKRARKFLEEN